MTTQMLKITKMVSFLLYTKEPVTFKRTPPKMPILSKSTTLIREYKSLAERWVIKSYVRFDSMMSFEDDIDHCILAELAVLKASRYCLRGS